MRQFSPVSVTVKEGKGEGRGGGSERNGVNTTLSCADCQDAPPSQISYNH